MANEKLVRVSDDVKESLEKLKGKIGNSEGDVISSLVRHYQKNHIELDQEVSHELTETKNYFGTKSDSNVVRILLHHFKESPTITKSTYELTKLSRY
jgi:predicted CopG family antitoxin